MGYLKALNHIIYIVYMKGSQSLRLKYLSIHESVVACSHWGYTVGFLCSGI